MSKKKKHAEPEKKPSPTAEMSVSHQNGNNLVSNAPALFDRRITEANFASNLSTSMVNGKYEVDKQNRITLSSGLLTSWEQRDKPYENTTRERWLNTMTAAKTISLKHGDVIALTASGVVATGDQKGPPVSYFNPEAKIFKKMDNCTVSGGVGTVAGEHIAKKQLYLTGGIKSGVLAAQMNVGAAEFYPGSAQANAPVTDRYAVRTMTSVDWQINDRNKLQYFNSYDEHSSNRPGQTRNGLIYEKKFGKDGKGAVRGAVITSSNAAHSIEDAHVRADIPFDLAQGDKNTLAAAATLFAGCVGEQKTPQNDHPSGLNFVYGAGLKVGIKRRVR